MRKGDYMMSKAYLTIDDGPTKLTRAMIDYLKSKNIMPVLFFYGQQLEKHFEEGLYALQQGAIIGNHSYSHPNFNNISFEECVHEIEKMDALLERLYQAAGMERTYKLFRFPYGAKGGENKALIQQYLLEHHYNRIDDSLIDIEWYKSNELNKDIDTFWTFDFTEYQLNHSAEFTYDSILKRIHDPNPETGAPLLENNLYHIILIHDHESTDNILPDYYKKLIDYVIDQGVEFIAPRISAGVRRESV